MNQISIQLPKPHPGQLKVLESKARWRVLLCGRRWGKSLVSQIVSIQRMLKGQHVAYVTMRHEDGRKFYDDVLSYLPQAVIQSDNKTDRCIKLVTGGSITFYSGEALDSFRGKKYHLCVVDEAAFIPDLKNAWGKAIRPTLTDYQGDAIFISTPRGKEFFYSLFQRGLDGVPGYESFHFTTYDNPHIPAGEVDEAKKELTEAEFREEYLAIAGENAANPFGTEHIKNNTVTTLSINPTVVLGIDVARTSDWTVITGLDADGHMTYFERFQLPWELTKERIRQLPGDIPKYLDSTGVGSVLLEDLQLTVPNLYGFLFTTESKPRIMYELIKDVEQGKVKFNEKTADEMSVFQYTYTSTGHIKFEAQTGFHDDAVCALAIANHHKKQAMQQAQRASTWKLYTI